MLKLKDLVSISGCVQINFDKLSRRSFKNVTIDSRLVKKGDIFFAIKGDRTDGHEYVTEVFRKGASLAVVSLDWLKKNKGRFKGKVLLAVKDTVIALGEFARIHKNNFRIPVLCIGGSNGKTTTKDLVAAVLNEKYRVLKTEGNFNNHIGLPLTLLRLNERHEFCVLEAGCNHFGEIKYLCGIAEPDFGMVTNIGKEHLEFFKNKRGVAKAEFELYDYLKKKDGGKIFVNLDDEFIKKYSAGVSNEKKFSYGYKFNPDVKGRFEGYNKSYQPRFKVRYGQKEFETYVSTFGKHSIYNGLAAAAVGLYFSLSIKDIKKALQNFKNSSSKRMEILNAKGYTIINDTYNSNPESVRMGLETLLGFKNQGEKYAVLADMLELGRASWTEHSHVGVLAGNLGIKNLYTYGKESFSTFSSAKKVKNNFYFESKEDLIELLRRNLKEGDIIYVKGSRGMKMEEIVKGLTEK